MLNHTNTAVMNSIIIIIMNSFFYSLIIISYNYIPVDTHPM